MSRACDHRSMPEAAAAPTAEPRPPRKLYRSADGRLARRRGAGARRASRAARDLGAARLRRPVHGRRPRRAAVRRVLVLRAARRRRGRRRGRTPVAARPRRDGRRRLVTRKPDKGQIVALLALVVVAMVFVGNVEPRQPRQARISGRSCWSARASPWSGGRRTTPAGPAGWRSAAAAAAAAGRGPPPVSLLVGAGVTGIFVLQGSGSHLGARPAGRARRPRRHRAARRPLPGADDAGPLRGAADAHPRPGAGRGRRPRPRLGAAHPHPDPAQRRRRRARCARLARAQERELRAWLYKPEGTGKDEDEEPDTLAEAVQAQPPPRSRTSTACPSRSSCVGDCPLDERLAAQMQAAREAMVNAAKYGGEGGAVQVYAEVEGAHGLRLRTRPRPGLRPGRGARRPDGRTGVDHRPDAAQRRHGAAARPRPDGGTEVELEMERADGMSERRGDERRRGPGSGAAGSSGRTSVRVVLVDDHRMFRTGVQAEIGADRATPASRWSARPPTSTRRSP